MMQMEKVKLCELADIYLGVTHTPEYVFDGVPFLSVKDISSGKICFDDCKYISKEEYESLSEGAKPKVGDMLFCRVGTLGKPIIIPEGTPLFGSFVSLGYLRNKNADRCDLNYLRYWMYSNSFWKQVNSNVKGASQVNLNTGWLSKFDIDLPDMPEQKYRISVLDKCKVIIEQREEELKVLDDLIKARFVELFGDRYVNDKNWNTTKLGESISFNNGKAHEQVVDENGEYILVTSRAIASDFEDVRRTNALLFPLHKNDIVMVMSDVPNGKALAKCQLIDSNDKYTLNQRICSFDNYEYNPIFLLHLLNRHPYFLSFNDGNGQTNLRKNDILECELIIPPMELQEQFADFVKQTDKSKVAVQKSLDETQQLFDSLMQQYFG